MTDINLLPWREKRREEKKRGFIILLMLGVAMACLVTFGIYYYSTELILEQTARNQRLKDKITIYENRIKEISGLKKLRQALVSRMMVVQNLQVTRTLTVRLFDEVIKIMPDGAYLTHIDRVKDKITVKGFAESNTNISEMMRKIEASSWIQHPQLTEIKKSEDGSKDASQLKEQDKNEFNLSFILKPKTMFGVTP